jgi:ABC-type multidrug transport system fused ATPase/permease subunit
MNKKKDLDIQLLENTKFNDLLEKVNSNFQRVVWSAYYIFYVIASFISLLVAIFALGFYNWYFVLMMVVAVFPVLFLEIKFGRTKWGIWDAEASERRKYNEYILIRYQTPISMIYITKVPQRSLKEKNDHAKIILTLPENSFDRAEQKDPQLLEEIVQNLSSQYNPMDPIKGLKLIL